MSDLVERLTNAANALVVLRQGVTLEAAKALPPTDPVIVADILEEAADRIKALEDALREAEAGLDAAARIINDDSDSALDNIAVVRAKVAVRAALAKHGEKP